MATSLVYLLVKEQKGQLERIKKLPLVRLENGKHVCASDQSVFLPPSTDKAHVKKSNLFRATSCAILMSTLLEGEERNEIEVLLKRRGLS